MFFRGVSEVEDLEPANRLSQYNINIFHMLMLNFSRKDRILTRSGNYSVAGAKYAGLKSASCFSNEAKQL
jgi:hypothetical protein